MEKVKLLEIKNNYNGKIEIIKNILSDVKTRKKSHYKQFAKYKKINILLKCIVNGLNSISICSLILTFTPVVPVVMIIALASASIGGITHAITSSIDIEEKINRHNTSYLQYNDLFRDVNSRLLKNGMSSSDLDLLLSEINTRMSLIEDSSLPIRLLN